MNVVANESLDTLIPRLNSSTFKGGISLSENNLVYYMMWTHGKILERLLPERLYLEMFSMGFPRNHQFFEVFNEKLNQMMSGGLIDYYTSGFKDYLKPKRYAHLNNTPENLKMNRIESGFVIWFVSTSFALFGFTLEWVIKLKKYFIMKRTLSAFRNKVVENFDNSVEKRKSMRPANIEKAFLQLSEIEEVVDTQEVEAPAIDKGAKKTK